MLGVLAVTVDDVVALVKDDERVVVLPGEVAACGLVPGIFFAD